MSKHGRRGLSFFFSANNTNHWAFVYIAIIILETAVFTFYYYFLHIFYASLTAEIVAEPPVEPRVPVVLAGLIESV